MKKIAIFIFSFLCLSAFSQNWQGLVKVDSAPSWLGGVTAIGNNLYSIPYAYADTMYLPGSAIPVPPYSSCLVKMDNNGNVLFVKPLGKVEARFITHNSENVFITGIYHESFQIDSLSINSNIDSTDIFLACFDTLGNIKWLNKIGNNCYDLPFDVQADQTGNVFLTGKVPGLCNPFYNSRGELFLSKFNALGQLLWKKTLDSTMWNPQVNIGTDGAIYLTGCFNDSIRVNDLSNTWAYYANQGGVLVKMDSNLYVDWVKILPRINSAYTVTFKASVDNNQNVYLPVGTLGSFTCDGDTFDGSAIIKFDSSGSINQYMYPGVGTYYPHIKYMPDNTIGVMCKTQDFEKVLKLGMGLNIIYTGYILNHHNWGAHEAFFDSDNDGNFLIAGNTTDSLSFSNSSLLLPRPILFSQQTYYITYGNLSTGVSNIINKENNVIVFPNPSSGTFTVKMSKRQLLTKVTVRDELGKCTFEKKCRPETSHQFDLSCLSPGIYFMEIHSEGERAVIKIILE